RRSGVDAESAAGSPPPLPPQTLRFLEDLIQPPGDDLAAVLLPLLDQVLELLDLGLEALDLLLVPLLALVGLLLEDFAQLGPDLVSVAAGLRLAELLDQLVGFVREAGLFRCLRPE